MRYYDDDVKCFLLGQRPGIHIGKMSLFSWRSFIESRPTPASLFSLEPIPRSCRGSNARLVLSQATWGRIRKYVYDRAGHACESCLIASDVVHKLHCHETWCYDGRKQILVGLQALCLICHGAIHFAGPEFRDAAAVFLCIINRWDMDKALCHYDKASAEWESRSQHAWRIDLSYLQEQSLLTNQEWDAISGCDWDTILEAERIKKHDATKALETDIHKFISACCRPSSGRVAARDLHHFYVRWCDACGKSADRLNRRDLWRMIEKAGYPKVGAKTYFFEGLELVA